MAKRKRIWILSNPKKENFNITQEEKEQVVQKFEPLIEEWKKTRIEAPHEYFSYKTDFYYKWFRSYFYLCAKSESKNPNRIADSFEDRFTRLEYRGNNKYNLAYMRHTGQWNELYQDKSLDQVFDIVKNDIIFHPI